MNPHAQGRRHPSLRSVRLALGLLSALAIAPRWVPAEPTPFAPGDPSRVAELIRRELRWLLAAQNWDGSWGQRTGVTGLVVLALEGLDGCEQPVGKARGLLRAGPLPQETYDVALSLIGLLVSGAPEAFDRTCAQRTVRADVDRPRLTALATELAGRYRSGGVSSAPGAAHVLGGWSYSRGAHACDMSNSAYAVWALATAARARVFRPAAEFWPSVQRALQGYGVERTPGHGMGFAYSGRRREATRSMTVDALCALHYVQGALVAQSATTAGPAGDVDNGAAQAFQWLDADAREGGEAPWDGQEHIYYHLFGLGRCMALRDAQALGGRDWYARGLQVLEDRQRGRGARGKQVEDHAFSLLFLRSSPELNAGAKPVLTGR